MTDRQTELLAAIRANDDDHTKLVYADYLEDHGDAPRANLIRLQCRIAALPAWHRDAIVAQWEVDHLLAEHGARFRGELPELPGVTWTSFTKGFVSSVKVASHAALVEHAAAIFAAAPVTRVELDQLDEQTPAPRSAVPWLQTLRLRVDGSTHRIDPRDSLLSQAPELELDQVSYDAVELLNRRDGKAPLQRLVIDGEHTAAAGLVRRLVELPGAKQLRELAIGTSFIDFDSGYYDDPTMRQAGAETLASGQLDKLQILDVNNQRVTSDGLGMLVDSMSALRELAARVCELEHFDFLDRSTGAPFTRVDIGANVLGDAAIRAFVTSPRARAIESLTVEVTELHSGGVTAIIESPCWQTLRVLDLRRNPLGVAGALSLAGAPRPEHLHTLRLANCDLTPEASRILAGIPWLAQLVCVDLSKNLVEPMLVAALAGVRDLHLANAPAGLSDALAGHWPRLVRAELSGTLGLELPAEAPELQTLELADCKVDIVAIERLVGGGFPRLRHLSLARTTFAPHALVRLLRTPFARQLDQLSLAKCELDDFAAGLVAAAAFPRIVTLDLRGNRFTQTGLLELARAEGLARIPSLRLSGQPWTFPVPAREELAARFGQYWYYNGSVDEDDDE